MKIDVTLPELSEEKDAVARVNQWLVAVGDRVSADDDLVEVLTDKAALILPSPAAGRVLELRASEGADVVFGDVLAVLETGVQ